MSLGPLMIDLLGPTVTPEEHELMRHPLVGGVILFSRNYVDPEQLTQLVTAIHASRSPPLIVAVDQEGGRVQRFRTGFSILPPARRIGHEFDLDARAGLDLARRMGWLMAAELRSVGVDMSFAPDVDLDYGISEIIGDRAFHARPQVVGQLAVAYMHGMRDAGMAATAKHFPAHGAVVADSHLTLPVDRRDLPDLSDDLSPYTRLIANGLPAVMVAHVLFPAVDSVPASLSSRWIRDVLRGDLRFQGVVFADDLSMGGAAAAYGDIVTRARHALSAGCDMLPVCNNRAGVVTLLDRLDVEPEPASRIRLVRMHGKDGIPRRELTSLPEWKRSRELLARCTAAPTLNLEAGST
jgi:beta-N-acetylhexosaminidase